MGISQQWAKEEGDERGGRKGRKGDEIYECCNEVDVYHPKICLAAKERRGSVASTKKRNVEEEAWENKDGLGRGRERKQGGGK